MLRVGTDCSGIEAPIQALQNLRIPFRHVFSCEKDEHCMESLVANYTPEHLFSDMTDRDTKKLPDIDIYICGFPCQPFSNAGYRQGMQDEKGRGNLFWYCLDVIATKMPYYFILENVKGLVTIDNGNTFDTIIKELSSVGYTVYWNVLNTKDYGIPQQRERLYMVGIRSDIKQTFTWPEPKPMKSLESFIDDKNNEREPIPEFVKRSGLLKHIPKDSLFIDIGFTQSNFVNSGVVCPCITTQGNLWCVPMKRHASNEECLSLQGFPRSFKQVVSDRQFKKQIGNSMSVNVLEEIFKNLLLQ
jgi:DNA (cytosine-5)-methyltransferase 1